MRIIAGRHRGRTILGPDSPTTRPITDRAKQSIFDILAPRIEGAAVFDLFAGTGSMGLESLSRGAARVSFFEHDRSALIRLRKNLATLGEKGKATVIDKDIFRWFVSSPIPSQMEGGVRVQTGRTTEIDMIFLDPPYIYVRERADELQSLARSLATHHLKSDGILIFRHEQRDKLELPGLAVIDSRSYGSMAIDLLQPMTTPADEIST